MRIARVIFLGYLAWLLILFLPAHTRGQITLGPREAGCCPTQPERTCCDADDGRGKTNSPTAADRANCAVCYWAAGLLTTPAFVLDTTHAERAYEHARHYHAQVQFVACRLNQYGRDPPSAPLDPRV